jgi:hypothetical protein
MLSRTFAKQYKEEWFTLDELLSSVLADVTSADANFQLTQTKAWQDFTYSISDFSSRTDVSASELAAGFGRLENLGIQNMSFSLPLILYQPSMLKRFWWLIMRTLGKELAPSEAKYKIARKQAQRALIQVQINAVRQRNGKWEVSSEDAF